MSSRRTSGRARKQIDYSKIGEIEGISEDELGGKLHKDVQSDSDEFELDETKQGEVADDDDISDMDIVPEVDDEGEGEDELLDDDIIEVNPKTKSKGKTIRNQRNSDDDEPALEELTELTSSGQKKPLKVNKMPKPAVLRPSKAPGSRAESLKERFQLFYGNNDDTFVYAINQRIKWGMRVLIPEPDLFDVPEKIIRLQSDDTNDLFPTEKSNQKLIAISYQEMTSYVPGNSKVIKVQTDLESDIQISLTCFESAFIHKSNPQSGFIVNVGSFVSSATWAPGFDGVQYLAVSTLIDGGDSSVYPEISGFATQTSPCSIQIYQVNADIPKDAVNPNGEYFQLISVYTTEYGPITKLAWRPSGPRKTSPNHIGVLAASFQDGKARLLDIWAPSSTSASPPPEPQFFSIDSFLREYSLDSKITCLVWRTINNLVVGTADGFIGEFDLTDESSDGIYPSYYVPIHDSYINIVETCFPDYEFLVFTSSADGFTRLVDIRDPLRSRTISTRFKGYTNCASYCYHLRSFISLEDAFTVKLTPIRRLTILQGATSVTRHEASVTSVSGSYLHPMVLSGGADGTVHIGNSIRRATVSKRQTNAIYREIILWEFDAPEELTNMYKFVDILKAKDLPKAPAIERQFIYPRTSIISTIEWNQNKSAGSWYVAGTSSGILRIENLALP